MSADSNCPITWRKTWILNPVFSKCVFPRRRPPKNGVFVRGVLPRKETRSVTESLPRRLQHDIYPMLLQWKASLRCKKELNEDLFSFPQRVSRKTTDLDDFDGQHGLCLNRLYCLSMEIHDLDVLGALSSVFAALRQLQHRLNRIFPLTRSITYICTPGHGFQSLCKVSTPNITLFWRYASTTGRILEN